MVHPFTAVPLGFSVMGSDTLWWGGCAWDSFALPQLFPKQGPMLVATSCPACEAAHAWRIDNRQPPEGDQVAHFPVPLAHMWDDVVFTCRHQRLFCGPGLRRPMAHCLNRTGLSGGSVSWFLPR